MTTKDSGHTDPVSKGNKPLAVSVESGVEVALCCTLIVYLNTFCTILTNSKWFLYKTRLNVLKASMQKFLVPFLSALRKLFPSLFFPCNVRNNFHTTGCSRHSLKILWRSYMCKITCQINSRQPFQLLFSWAHGNLK